jgi:hypothetical protein
MRRHFPQYKTGEAPTVLMSDEAHDLTRGIFKRWHTMMKNKMGGTMDWGKVSENEIRNLSEELFDAAEVPKGVRQEFWKQFEQYKATLSR